jgi:hypothetical protein
VKLQKKLEDNIKVDIMNMGCDDRKIEANSSRGISGDEPNGSCYIVVNHAVNYLRKSRYFISLRFNSTAMEIRVCQKINQIIHNPKNKT